MRFRLVDAALVGVLAISLAISTSLLLPPAAKGYSFGSWVTRWYTASAAECQQANKAANNFIGPIQRYGHGCDFPVRVRYATVNTSPWSDRVVQLENTSPVWNAWGMTLQVQVHWNGTIAKHDPSSLWCTERSFFVHVERRECRVWNDSTSDMLVRMAYDASFTIQGIGVSAQRGAEVHVRGSGPDTGARLWP